MNLVKISWVFQAWERLRDPLTQTSSVYREMFAEDQRDYTTVAKKLPSFG